MTLSEEDVAHVAVLARLGLSDQEREQFRVQLGAILEHVSQLEKIDTSSVSATAQVGDIVNAWREDEIGECLSVEAALNDAPEKVGQQFKVGAIQE